MEGGIPILKKKVKAGLIFGTLVALLAVFIIAIVYPSYSIETDPSEVARVIIVDAHRSGTLELQDEMEIAEFLKQLNATERSCAGIDLWFFKKGFHFAIDMRDQGGRILKEIEIGNTALLRYKGIEYTMADGTLIEYIDGLFEK